MFPEGFITRRKPNNLWTGITNGRLSIWDVGKLILLVFLTLCASSDVVPESFQNGSAFGLRRLSENLRSVFVASSLVFSCAKVGIVPRLRLKLFESIPQDHLQYCFVVFSV